MPPLVRPLRTLIVALLVGLVASAASTGFAEPVTHRVLVVPVNLGAPASVVVDRGQITQVLYGAADSVASRYRAKSYGVVRFAG
jgi:hypothetical protein